MMAVIHQRGAVDSRFIASAEIQDMSSAHISSVNTSKSFLLSILILLKEFVLGPLQKTC
jgi:hypothetical protein